MEFIKIKKEEIVEHNLTLTRKRPFIDLGVISLESKKECFEFAKAMTFNKQGEQRNHRSGGTEQRDQYQIFNDTIEGKLSEFAVYEYLSQKGIKVQKPNLDTYQLGKWDDADFIFNGHKISVKSTKYYGNLLLLEKKDWNEKGQYIPNGNENYDATILVRLRPYPYDLFKSPSLAIYYPHIDSDVVKSEIHFDIPGFITQEDLVSLIKNGFEIKKGDKLGNKTVDADNYYCQAGNMRPIEDISKILNN
jgi:hypothetical protein